MGHQNVLRTEPPNYVEEGTLGIHEYLRVARRRWRSIVACVIAGCALAAAITFQTTPLYASSARVFVSTAPSNSSEAYQGSLFSQERVRSYIEVIGGLELAQRVVDRLDLKASAESLASNIDVEVVAESVVIKITVFDERPALAQRISKGVVREFQYIVAELETPQNRKVSLVKATVVDPPRLPTDPVSPKPMRDLGLGAILGLLLGVAFALLREQLDTTVKHVEDVPELAETPMLSLLAYDDQVPDRPLVTSLPSHAARVEAYRVLRTNLSFIKIDYASKALVITSAVPSEGKSTVAVNVALAMASTGQRVLLIDADLRRPQVARLLALESSVGVSTVIGGNGDLAECTQTHAPSGLEVLASGILPPNPAEMLQSNGMRELLASAKSDYDVVVVDTPPLLPVTDAALMAAQTDGAILVIHHGKTTKEQVAGAVARLKAVGTAPLGVIFNMAQTGRLGRYGYGYGYAPAKSGQKHHNSGRA